jgi:hypothetical protein
MQTHTVDRNIHFSSFTDTEQIRVKNWNGQSARKQWMRGRDGFRLTYPRRDYSTFSDTEQIRVKNWNQQSASRL